MDARTVHSSKISQHIPVFLEHYPLFIKEEELVKFWEVKDIEAYSSLDEAIFPQFGGENIVEMVKRWACRKMKQFHIPLSQNQYEMLRKN